MLQRAPVFCLHRQMLLLGWFIFMGLLPCAAHGAERTVVVDGSGPVINGDEIQARDEALIDARIKAVEQAVGVIIQSRNILEHELLIASEVKTFARGVLVSEQVLKEYLGDDGFFHVRLKAVVSEDEAAARFRQLLREDRIVLAVSEEGVDSESSKVFENMLVSKLNSMGYQHIDVWRPGTRDDLETLVKASDNAQLDKLGMSYMADVVVVGEMQAAPSSNPAAGLYAAHGNGRLQVYLVKLGKTLASSSIEQQRGFGANEQAAVRDAVRKTGTALSDAALPKITPREARTLRVIIRGIPDYSSFKRYTHLLEAMRWVQSVKAGGFSEARSVFTLEYGESPDLLAARLNTFPGLEVVGFGTDGIELAIVEE